MVEQLENRRMLSVVANTVTVPSPLSGEVKGGVNIVGEVTAIHDKIFAATQNLPLIGSGIFGAKNGTTDKLSALGSSITSTLASLPSSYTGTVLQSTLTAALGHALPGGTVAVVLEDTTTTGTSTNPNQVDINLDFAGTLLSAAATPNFSLGIPGLGLSLTGSVQANLTYDVKIDLVVNTTTQNFYVDLSPSPEANLTLAVTTPGLSATGTLGFFQLTATDGTPAGNPTAHTQLVGTIGLDLSVGGNNQLNATNIASLVGNSTLSASAEADVHLATVLSFAGNTTFPTLSADLDITWSLANASLGADASGKFGVTSSVFGSKPDIQFNNVQLGLGTFFTNFLTPITSNIKKALAPVQPVIDMLNSPAPLFNDLHVGDLNGDGTVTVLEAVETFLGNVSPQAVKFINAVNDVYTLIQSIPDNAANVMLPLGHFEVGGGATGSDSTDLRGTPLASAAIANETADDTASELASDGNSNSKIASFVSALNATDLQGGADDGGGFHVPLLQNPLMVFDLLLGQNVDLFTFDTPTLSLSPSISFEVAPIDFLPFIKVQFAGEADFTAHLSMGYDTYGLTEFAKNLYAPADIGNLLDGFYVVDDPTKTYASASLTLSVALGIDVYIATFYARGGITGTVTFTLDDPNSAIDGGKYRATAIAAQVVKNPLSLFDINGTITASFDLDGQYLGIPYKYVVATTTLASFSITPSAPPSVPSFGSVSNGLLTLNIPNGDQYYQVVHASNGGDGTENVNVISGGVTQSFTEVNAIVGVCGTGNDDIGVICNSPVTLTGGSGNDTLIVGDDENATINGGSGDDFLGAVDGPYTASTGNLSVNGGGGNNTIQGGGGSDLLVAGGNGNNLIYGGGGTDSLMAGGGNDTLYGGDNTGTQDEVLIGGSGSDTFIADNTANPSDPLGLGGPQYIQGGQGQNTIQFDHTDIIVGAGAYANEVEEGFTTEQNGVPVNTTARPTIVKLPTTTTTVSYTGNSLAGAILSGSTAYDKLTNQQLLGPIELIFVNAQGTFGAPVDAGTYTVFGYYLGDSTHAPSPVLTTTLVVNPVAPTISGTNILVSFDGQPHVGSATATGPLGQNVSSQLSLSYKNTTTNVVTTAPPTAAGTYEVYASFAANRDYNAVGSTDTGHTLTISTIFNAPSVVAADPNLFGSMTGDVNGDGIPDLITEDLSGTSGTAILNVYIGNGNGTFKAPKVNTIAQVNGQLPYLPTGPQQGLAFVADLNGDGKPDLLTFTFRFGTLGYGIEEIFGNGDGTFQAPSATYEGDGPLRTDIVPAALLKGSSAIGFVTNEYESPTSGYLNTVDVEYSENNGSFSDLGLTVGEAPRGVAVGDFNNDGNPDIIVSDEGGTGILLQTGTGVFGPETYFSSVDTFQIAVADLNHDGKPDVVLGDGSGITAYLGTGQGTFGAAIRVTTNPAGSIASPVVVGDYNGDGTPDIATFVAPLASFVGSSTQVFYGNGDGTFASPLTYAVTTTAIVGADLNGDGVTDLISVDNSGDVNVILNKKPSIAATVTSSGVTATYDGQTHGATVTATGLHSLSLSSLLTVTYLNTVTNAVLTSPPTQGGIYDVLVSFAGNTAYNAVAQYDTHQQVVIKPGAVALGFSGVNVPADGAAHAAVGSATGVSGENLSGLLNLSYQSKATGAISLTPPAAPGSYEVLATFQGNANYAYVPTFDTGRTVVITPPAASPGGVILSDHFTNAGGPYGTTAYANAATVGGHQPDSVDLPGGAYTYYVTTSTFAGGVIDTMLGNAGSSFEMGPQSALAAPLSAATGGYVEPSLLTLSVDLEMSSIAGTDQAFRGIALGLAATAPTGVAANGDPINNGVLVGATTGNLSLVGSAGTTVTAITGGNYNATLLGPWNPNGFYRLTYTVNAATGAVTNLSLSDAQGTETIASAGTLGGFVTGTGGATSTANFVTVSSSGNNGAAFGFVDNLLVKAAAVPANLPPTGTTGAPTSVGSTSAILHGTVNPQGSSTTTAYEYSTTTTFAPTLQSTLSSVFTGINAVAVDAAGNAYVADFSANAVERVQTNGFVTPLGSGWNGPAGVAIDSAGDVYVAEFFGSDVKEVLPNGTVRTVGSGFSSAQGVAVDAAGDVYVGYSGQVKEILPNGTQQAVSSGWNNPSGLALDAAGDLFVSDQGTNAVYEVLTGGTKVTLATGFNRPQSLALDGAGDVYVADFNNNAVKEILPGGSVVPVGSGFSNPIGVAVDSAGDLLVAANGTHQLLKLSPATMFAVTASTSGSTPFPASATVSGLAPNTKYYYRIVATSSAGVFAGSTASFTTLQTGQAGPGAVILDDGFTNPGPSPYANGSLVNGNKPDVADLPGSTYSYYTTNHGYKGGTVATAAGNTGSSATVGPQSNIVASLQSAGVYAEPSVLTLSVDLEMNTLAGTDSPSRGIGLGLNASVPNGFNAGNPANNGVLVNAATGNLYFTGSNGGTVSAVPGGTYNAALLGPFSPTRFYTLTFTVNSATGAVTNLSLGDAQGTETIASPGSIPGYVAGTGAATSTANYVDVSSNGNDGSASGYVDNLTVSVASAPAAASAAPTTITTTGATLAGTVNAQGPAATTLFQYSTDPSFAPTVSTLVGVVSAAPNGVAVDAAGNVYVSSGALYTVRRYTPGGSLSTIGTGFINPYGLAVDAAGNVFVGDYYNNQVREITAGGAIVTVASGFSGPEGVAVDAAGDLFVADSGHNAVREVLPGGTVVTIGSGFSSPQGVAVDAVGDVFVADATGVHEVLATGTIVTIGSGFAAPAGVAVDAAGDVFVADTNNNAVKEVLPGGTIVPLGSGFAQPTSVAVDAIGDVIVADYGHNRVYKLSPPTVAATPGTVTGTAATSLSASVTGLSANTVYYYRAIAQGAGGTSVGVTNAFILAPAAGSGIAAISVPSLTLGNGASFTLGTAAATSDRTVLVVNTLSLGTGAQLNLGGNDLIIHSFAPTTQAQTLAAITGSLQAGFNGGSWSGPGIASTAAAGNARHLTALGVMPVTTAGSFDGQGVTPTDVLVKYTYYGDANLDGSVTAADYTRIDGGYITHATGWANGDFNYDGVVDGSDYALIDNAFNQQTARIAAAVNVVATRSRAAPDHVATRPATSDPSAASAVSVQTRRTAATPAAADRKGSPFANAGAITAAGQSGWSTGGSDSFWAKRERGRPADLA